MPRGFCTLICIPEPFAVTNADSTAATYSVADPVTVVWSAGGNESWAVGRTLGTINPQGTAWLLLAVQGQGPYFIQEADMANVDTLLTGATWAILRRAADGLFYPVPNI